MGSDFDFDAFAAAVGIDRTMMNIEGYDHLDGGYYDAFDAMMFGEISLAFDPNSSQFEGGEYVYDPNGPLSYAEYEAFLDELDYIDDYLDDLNYDSGSVFDLAAALTAAQDIVDLIAGLNSGDIENHNTGGATNPLEVHVHLTAISNADLATLSSDIGNFANERTVFGESLWDEYNATADEARASAICDINHNEGHTHADLTTDCHNSGDN